MRTKSIGYASIFFRFFIKIIVLQIIIIVIFPIALANHSQQIFPIEVQSFSSKPNTLEDANVSFLGNIELSEDYVLNQRNTVLSSDDVKPSYSETSEFMIGIVGIHLIFIESNGEVDQNTEDWSNERMEDVENEVYQALDWWRDQYPFDSAKLEFLVNSERIIGSTKYEPISRPREDAKIWAEDVLINLDCGTGTSDYTLAKSCANSIREEWGTDWAFIIFVVDSLNDPDGAFQFGTLAWAYWFGPYMVLTYDNGNWGISRMDRVAAHEIGHIFGATDEYDRDGELGGYLYLEETDNSNCIMDTSSWCISSGTKNQIGWIDENQNNHPDLLENQILIEFDNKPEQFTDQTPLIYEGRISFQPYPCGRPNCRSVTINKIVNVSSTRYILADDGAFDSESESFRIVVPTVEAGYYEINIEVTDLLGLKSETITGNYFTYIIVNDSRFIDNRTRSDVNSSKQLNFQLVWAHSNEVIEKGKIWIKNFEGSSIQDGWFSIDVASEKIGKETYIVDRVEGQIDSSESQIIIRKLESKISPLEVFWDRVKIELYTDKSRVDLGRPVDVYFRAFYEFDNTKFEGKVKINRNLTQEEVGKYNYRVESIDDQKFGLTSFTSNNLNIIFDTINIRINSPKNRFDIGSNATIFVIAKYEYDSVEFEGKIELNDTTTHTNIGKHFYTVKSIIDDKYKLKSFKSNVIEVIFDYVEIVIYSNSTRVDVGTYPEIDYDGHYAYDKSKFQGSFSIKDDIVLDKVGKYTFAVETISDNLYDLAIFKSNKLEIILDRIIININTTNKRINLWDIPVIEIEGKYEFDNIPFQGAVFLNDTLKKTTPGKYTFTVKKISDPFENLTSFRSNIVRIIFDRVSIHLVAEYDYLALGKNASIYYIASYDYDKSPFKGKIMLNEETERSEAGKVSYQVGEIVDELYNLKAFQSNTVDIVFDRIKWVEEVNTYTPSRMNIKLVVQYENDGHAVENANIIINNFQAENLGNGIYQSDLLNYLPITSMNVKIDNKGFPIEEKEIIVISYGNILVIGIISAISIVTSVHLIRDRKKKLDNVSQLNVKNVFLNFLSNIIIQKKSA